jgi:hypothetical protein
MFKKSLDIISLAAVAVFVGVGIWLAVWGESPREPGHISIQSKMIVADVVPLAFGVIWLIFRCECCGGKVSVPLRLQPRPSPAPVLFYERRLCGMADLECRKGCLGGGGTSMVKSDVRFMFENIRDA